MRFLGFNGLVVDLACGSFGKGGFGLGWVGARGEGVLIYVKNSVSPMFECSA